MTLKTRIKRLEVEQADRPTGSGPGVVIYLDDDDLKRKLAALRESSSDGDGTVVFLPHNNRDPLPDEQ